MIFGVGQNPPRVRHETEHAAFAEAKRLARNNPGVEFYVLESMARAVKDEVRFERMAPSLHDGGIPF